MAYALKLPVDVTDLIYQMRDWRYEMVRAGGKTPSANCLNFKYTSGYVGELAELPFIIVRNMPCYLDTHPFGRYSENMNDEERLYHEARWGPPEPFIRVRDAKWIWGRVPLTLPSEYRWELTATTLSYGQSGNASRFGGEREEYAMNEMWFQCEPCGDF
jgi:hypothetical protein